MLVGDFQKKKSPKLDRTPGLLFPSEVYPFSHLVLSFIFIYPPTMMLGFQIYANIFWCLVQCVVKRPLVSYLLILFFPCFYISPFHGA